jgi:polysaccharide deacetylase 2 family uncharacterized protein YibQ
VLGGGFLAVMSLMFPATVLPPPETSSEVGGTEKPLADVAPVRLPSPLSQPERHDAAQVTRPDQDNVAALADGQDPGPAPVLTAPDTGLGEGPEGAPSSNLPRVAPDSSVLPSPLAIGPAAPASDAAPEITTKPALPPRAEPGETITGFPSDDLNQTATAPEPVAPPEAVQVDQKPVVIAEAPAPERQTPPEPATSEPTPTEAARVEATRLEPAAPDAVDARTPDQAPSAEGDAAMQTPLADGPAPGSDPEKAPRAQAEGTETGTDKAAAPDATAPAAPLDSPLAKDAKPDVPAAQASGPEIPPETAPETPDPDATPAPPTVSMPGEPGIRLTEDSPAATAEPVPEVVVDTRPPIDRFAEPFENPEGRPIVAIVLLDSEKDGATTDMPARFPYPVSIAVPVDAPDAASRMRRYRDAGYEVLALADLPAGATPADVKTISSAWFDALPEAVAIMERPPATLQSDRANGEQLADILTESGHGLLLFPDGLDTTRKLAARQGVPAATVFRDLDGAGQGESVVRRFLDHSAFKAGVEGSVILVTRLRPDTLQALLVWGLADRASRVALAPVSYALKAAAP